MAGGAWKEECVAECRHGRGHMSCIVGETATAPRLWQGNVFIIMCQGFCPQGVHAWLEQGRGVWHAWWGHVWHGGMYAQVVWVPGWHACQGSMHRRGMHAQRTSIPGGCMPGAYVVRQWGACMAGGAWHGEYVAGACLVGACGHV